MDPKQTASQGGSPGGQEGQNGQPQDSSATSVGASPVFSPAGIAGTAAGASSSASSPSAGMLGSNTLSTGANVSRAIDSLNSKNPSATSQSIFKRKKFEKVVPVSGDIIINTDPEKQNAPKTSLDKAKMIKFGGILGGIVAVVLIVAIVIAFVMGGGKKKETTPTVIANNTLPEFSQPFEDYAGYILFGTDGEFSIDADINIDIAEQYKADDVLSLSSDDIKSYYQTAGSYFDSFIESYNSSNENNQSVILVSFIPSYTKVFDFMRNYANAERLDDEILLPIYVASGDSGLDQYYETEYAVFRDSEYYGAVNYYKYQKDYLNYKKAYYAIAQQSGCIRNSAIVSGCNVTVSNENTQLMEDAIRHSDAVLNGSTDELITGIGLIRNEIIDPTTEEKMNSIIESSMDDNGGDAE